MPANPRKLPDNAILIPDNAKRAFQGKIFDVYQWEQKMYDGSFETFEMLKRPDTVETICVVDDKILLLTDEQPNRGPRLSFAGGRVDEGEDILAAAKREVREETGYEFQNWRLVKVWQPHGKIEWFVHLFIAWDGTSVAKPHLDAGEKITVRHLPLGKVKSLVVAGTDHLSEAGSVLESATRIEDLLSTPEFKGKEY